MIHKLLVIGHRLYKNQAANILLFAAWLLKLVNPRLQVLHFIVKHYSYQGLPMLRKNFTCATTALRMVGYSIY